MKIISLVIVLYGFLTLNPASAQSVDVDVLQLLAELEGDWHGELVLEKAQASAQEIDYQMSARLFGGQTLIQEHRFSFPQGPVQALEILTYDAASATVFISYFNARKRFVHDLKVTSASQGPNDTWRILTEHEETYGETRVTIRNLYQREGALFTKFRWVKDGEDYILSDSVKLTRVTSP